MWGSKTKLCWKLQNILTCLTVQNKMYKLGGVLEKGNESQRKRWTESCIESLYSL